MAEGLPYFKFNPEAWLSGDITLEEKDVQADFILICCYYWMRGCRVEIAKLQKKYGIVITKLLDSHIIHDNQGIAKIKFLDEQWAVLKSDWEKRSNGGKKGSKIRWGDKYIESQQVNNIPITDSIGEKFVSRTEQNRTEDIIIGKKNSISFKNEKPTIEQIRTFFFENGHESDCGEWADGFWELNEKRYGWLGLAKQTWQEMAANFKLIESEEKENYESPMRKKL